MHLQITATLSDLNKLSDEYDLVSNKTNALHNMSEQLLADQNKLSGIGKDCLNLTILYITFCDFMSILILIMLVPPYIKIFYIFKDLHYIFCKLTYSAHSGKAII